MSCNPKKKDDPDVLCEIRLQLQELRIDVEWLKKTLDEVKKILISMILAGAGIIISNFLVG